MNRAAGSPGAWFSQRIEPGARCWDVCVSGASVTVGVVALKGTALGTVVAIVLSLLFEHFDRLQLTSDRKPG